MDGIDTTPRPEVEDWASLGLQEEHLPPYSATPHPEIALEPRFLANMPRTFRLEGHYTSPDFALYDDRDQKILAVETDSYWISHEMELRELLGGTRLFTIKRSGGNTGKWMYVAKRPGKYGQKILEIETSPKLLENKTQSTRLTFRNNTISTATNNERQLVALDLRIGNGSQPNTAAVFHEDRKIGEIDSVRKAFKGPEFILRVLSADVDPTLLVIYALVMDDRTMSTRRRRRRPIGREALGIGKGPGAGLGMFYALGSIA